MTNLMDFDGYRAVISYDPEIEMFRGEFIGLNGGADFYASTVADLHKEGERSLKVFLASCREEGIEPRKPYSGRLNLRIDPQLHEAAAIKAAASNQSLNQLINDSLRQVVTL